MVLFLWGKHPWGGMLSCTVNVYFNLYEIAKCLPKYLEHIRTSSPDMWLHSLCCLFQNVRLITAYVHQWVDVSHVIGEVHIGGLLWLKCIFLRTKVVNFVFIYFSIIISSGWMFKFSLSTLLSFSLHSLYVVIILHISNRHSVPDMYSNIFMYWVCLCPHN